MHGLLEGFGSSAFQTIRTGVKRLGGSMFMSGARGANKAISDAGGTAVKDLSQFGSKPFGDITKSAGFGAEGSKLAADAAPSALGSRLKMRLGRMIGQHPTGAIGAAGAGLVGAGALGHKMLGGRRDRGY
jgi:hypothetical protein